VLRFPPPKKTGRHDITEILLKVAPRPIINTQMFDSPISCHGYVTVNMCKGMIIISKQYKRKKFLIDILLNSDTLSTSLVEQFQSVRQDKCSNILFSKRVIVCLNPNEQLSALL